MPGAGALDLSDGGDTNGTKKGVLKKKKKWERNSKVVMQKNCMLILSFILFHF